MVSISRSAPFSAEQDGCGVCDSICLWKLDNYSVAMLSVWASLTSLVYAIPDIVSIHGHRLIVIERLAGAVCVDVVSNYSWFQIGPQDSSCRQSGMIGTHLVSRRRVRCWDPVHPKFVLHFRVDSKAAPEALPPNPKKTTLREHLWHDIDVAVCANLPSMLAAMASYLSDDASRAWGWLVSARFLQRRPPRGGCFLRGCSCFPAFIHKKAAQEGGRNQLHRGMGIRNITAPNT